MFALNIYGCFTNILDSLKGVMYNVSMMNKTNTEAKTMRNDWRKAEVSDLNTLKMIDGKVYKGVAEAMLVDGEYETQVRWHRANWREVSRYMKAVR